MEFDIVITNGTVIDGTGRARYQADVGIRDGKIAAIATGEPLEASETLDAAGLAIAPGFIDLHSHSDFVVTEDSHQETLAPFVLQGMTTMVTGNCGFSPAPVTDESIPLVDDFSDMLRDDTFEYQWRSVEEFLDTIEANGVLLNTALLVGHGTLRYAVMGSSPQPPNPAQLEALRKLTRQALHEGAFGFSTGLGYAPGIFADNEELLALLKVVGEEDAVYTTHSRAYRWVSPFYRPMILGMPHNRRSTREQLDLARRAGVKIQLSHLLFHGRRTWPTYRSILNDVDEAANEGLDVAFDAFPYTFGNTTISVNFPAWFLDGFTHNIDNSRALGRLKREFTYQQWLIGRDYRDIVLLSGGDEALKDFEGLNFATIAERLNLPEFEAYMYVAQVSEGKARILQDTYSGDAEYEEPLRAVLAHPLCAFMLDSILTREGEPNPASYGTYPRLLGRYSRDLELFSLEEAIRRMTSFPAQRIGLTEIGRIAEGYWADLVVFNPDSIADNTTFQQPDAPPSGMKNVLISGQVVAHDGQLVSTERFGRVLRRR